MKKIFRSTVFLSIITAVFIIMFASIGCEQKPTSSTQDVYEIKFAVAEHGLIGESSATVQQWMESVEQASNGKIKFNVLVGSTTDPDNYDALVAGTGDCASNNTTMTPGRFPIMDMMTVCDIGTTCKHPSSAAWDFWKAYPEEIEGEFKGVKVLALWANSPAPVGIGFATVDKPIHTLADAKGLKVGQNSEYGIKTCVALGMSPISAGPDALYENLSKKIIDGSFLDPEMMDAFKLSELLKYYHEVNFNFMPKWLGFNKSAWDKLPADVQKILEDEAAKIPAWADEYCSKAAVNAIESAKTKYGLEVITFDDDEIARWQVLQDPIQQEYLDKLQKDKGVDAQAMFTTLNGLYEKYDK
jgi:TRAP-type C4-dicarboxylate transport system substrate-binding protein